MNILTIAALDSMRPGTVFSRGEIVDSPEGYNVGATGTMLKWVAVRGDIHDWAIYTDNPWEPKESFEEVQDWGEKVHSEKDIRKLVLCDDGAFALYRY